MNFLKSSGFVILFFSSVSFAQESGGGTKPFGIFVEPAVTYQLGKTSVDYPSPFSNSTGDNNGPGIAARLGIHLSEVVFVGVDARYAMTKFTDSAANSSSNATSYQYGPVAGIQMPNFGLRLWAAYVLGGELNPEESSNFDVKFLEAKGPRIGAGLRLMSVSLNLEYQDLTYGKTNLEKIGPFTGSTDFESVKLSEKAWIASVSFPIQL
jgi:hypothetical protein